MLRMEMPTPRTDAPPPPSTVQPPQGTSARRAPQRTGAQKHIPSPHRKRCREGICIQERSQKGSDMLHNQKSPLTTTGRKYGPPVTSARLPCRTQPNGPRSYGWDRRDRCRQHPPRAQPARQRRFQKVQVRCFRGRCRHACFPSRDR